jgi:hypothetical protein
MRVVPNPAADVIVACFVRRDLPKPDWRILCSLTQPHSAGNSFFAPLSGYYDGATLTAGFAGVSAPLRSA